MFTYFSWVLLQPFRGNPEYKDVASMPYKTECLEGIASNDNEADLHTLGSCIVEAMYNTTCILQSVRSAGGRSISQEDIGDCLLNTDAGFGSTFVKINYLKSAAVPMWMVYQFMVSVVLLRILIVMMTITYRRIYDDLDKQWKYARANTGIQFFDKDSLLPPPFTFLSILVKAFTFISDSRRTKGNTSGSKEGSPHAQNGDATANSATAAAKSESAITGGGGGGHDPAYISLVFSLLDSVKGAHQDRRDGESYGGGSARGSTQTMKRLDCLDLC